MDKKGIIKIVGIIVVFAGALIWLFAFGGLEYFSIEALINILDDIRGYGILVPIVYILLYWVVCLFFLPGLPITIVGGLLFGPVKGSIFISIASTSGATLAMLVGRTVGREWILKKFGDSRVFKKIDEGLKENGWRMLMITRLVPLFPFNVQNYIYGLTDIKVGTYILVSWICMLPATIAYASIAGAIEKGEGNLGNMFLYLGIGAVLIVGLSFVPKLLAKKGYQVDSDSYDN
jgi:uncharacterized membrane protein YdjX (TVP38/TMEM64 family)